MTALESKFSALNASIFIILTVLFVDSFDKLHPLSHLITVFLFLFLVGGMETH